MRLVGFHGFGDAIAGRLVRVPHVGEAESAATVLVARKLGDCCLGTVCLVEFDDAGAAGAAVGFILDLCALDNADGGEEVYKVIVRGRPREL